MLPAALVLVLAQIAPAPVLVPVRAPTPPTIDGDLSDPVWALAAATSAFTQQFPEERAAPSERTTLKVLYDDDAVYIAFDLEQKTVPIVQRMARRDRDVESDSVTIDIDSRALGKTAFEFTVNAAGVLRDGIRSNDVIENGDRFSPGWDENWDARTVVRDGGWSAEIRIPLRILRFSFGGGIQTWGFQARRYTSMRQETDQWSLVPRNVASEVSMYGHLQDLRMRPRPDLELRPFVLGRLRRRDKTDVTLDSGLSPGASAGLDLRWHLTPDLTLDGTVNPDFTQVEGDELYLNLSNFESFFPEKRPFFVEGAEIFESPAPLFFARSFQLLYTRRIGRRPDAPALRPTPAFDDRLVTLPEPSTILGATKLVGRLGQSWSVGAMSAVTDFEHRRRARPRRRPADPARRPHHRLPGRALEARSRRGKGACRLPRDRGGARREDEPVPGLCAPRRLGNACDLSDRRGAHAGLTLHARRLRGERRRRLAIERRRDPALGARHLLGAEARSATHAPRRDGRRRRGRGLRRAGDRRTRGRLGARLECPISTCQQEARFQ